MKQTIKLFVISILLLSFTSIFAQGRMGEVGKLFKKDEANKLFGNPKTTLEISPKLLKVALLKANDYILFTVKNGKVILADEKKHALTENNVKLDRYEQSYIFSKSKVIEFLNAAFGNGSVQSAASMKDKAVEVLSSAATSPIYVELRESTLTLTAADATLEFSTVCPPVCFE